MKTDSATGPSEGPKVWKLSPRLLGEAVEVQAVVPVSASYQRQLMDPQMCHGVVYAAADVFHQRCLCPRGVVKGVGWSRMEKSPVSLT